MQGRQRRFIPAIRSLITPFGNSAHSRGSKGFREDCTEQKNVSRVCPIHALLNSNRANKRTIPFEVMFRVPRRGSQRDLYFFALLSLNIAS
ncbi:hypothetical protein TNCT_531921 [Trichonephila clavata]|uniref:Uncharacterized protein n=1 Tax=Trichonephila clavata TaxID=2740835 RepID=A0A8X6L5D6_TRICU|nr:hypothetical protein TNCT_531921 [Trichonephila clavata]